MNTKNQEGEDREGVRVIHPKRSQKRNVSLGNSPEYPDSPDVTNCSDSEQGFGRREKRKSYSPSLKLAIQHFSRPENKWFGPLDKRYRTDEYVQMYSHDILLFGATTSIIIKVLLFALMDDAQGEYIDHVKDSEEYSQLRNASSIIRIVGKRLETPEFIALAKNKWFDIALEDV